MTLYFHMILGFKISTIPDITYHHHGLTVPKDLSQSFEAFMLLMQL